MIVKWKINWDCCEEISTIEVLSSPINSYVVVLIEFSESKCLEEIIRHVTCCVVASTTM
jgi:hypothetical protein